MNTGRELLAQALTDALPADVRVYPHARNLENIKGRAVMLRMDAIRPHPLAPQAWHAYEFAVIVAHSAVTLETTEDELDALVAVVLSVLEGMDAPEWTEARRATLTDSEDRPRWPAYEVRCTIPVTSLDPA